MSVRKNRLYRADNSNKAPFKLVLAITAESREGNKMISKIKSSIDTAKVLVEAHQDEGIAHLLVYCKNTQTVADVMDGSFNGHTLRSSTRYEKTTKEDLHEKAKSFEATMRE